MNNLSIKAKTVGFLGLALLIVMGGTLYWNTHQSENSISELDNSCTANLRWTISRNVEFIMLNGVNEDIQPLVEEMTEMGIAHEVTIIDGEKHVARSSTTDLVGTESKDPIWDALFASGRDTVFDCTTDGEAMAVCYGVFQNEGGCTDCHDVDEEKILGGMKIVKSRQAIVDEMSSNASSTTLFMLCGSLLLIGSIWVILSRSIFRPLHGVQDVLDRAADGDVDQELDLSAKDEIGHLLQSVHRFMDYLRGFAGASKKIAEGDLRISVTPRSEKDVLGRSFATMTANLTGMIRQLDNNARELVSASTQISASSETMSRGARDQEDQMQTVSTAIEEMSSTIAQSAENSSEASEASRQSSETATQGGQVVSESVEGMLRIAEVVRGSAESAGRLADSVARIGEVVEVIDDIADQTNLLALNAAIEAARAGEAGRGFAVVADEVRKLADRTAKATGGIIDIVKGIQSETAAAVRAMENGMTEVEHGRELSDKAGHSLSEVVDLSARVMDMIQQIAEASTEQATAIEEIARSIEQATSVSRETSASSEQTASAAEQLSRQATSLQEIVDRFQIS